MKTKMLVLAILPLLVLISGCCDGSHGQIHGDAGVRAQSKDTSRISPERPAN